MIKKLFDLKFIKYCLVGVINTIVGAGTMFALYNIANCGYWFSSACNYIVGGVVSFFLNKYFTFGQKKHSLSYVVRFVICVAVCWVIAYAIARPAVTLVLANSPRVLRDNAAMAAGMVIYTILGYFGQRFFVFKDEK